MTQSISRPCNTPISPPSAGCWLAGWSLKSVPGFSAAADTPLLNGKLAHAFEAHYDKEFPIKRLGTNLWAALDYALFHESRPGVVIGRTAGCSPTKSSSRRRAASNWKTTGHWCAACSGS